VAALSHPHICTLHEIGHLDGETLAARLVRGKLPVDHAVLTLE
jgi:hypothetical protein